MSEKIGDPCPICGWPLKASIAEGCTPGNCSFRGMSEEVSAARYIAELQQELAESRANAAKAKEAVASYETIYATALGEVVQARADAAALRIALKWYGDLKYSHTMGLPPEVQWVAEKALEDTKAGASIVAELEKRRASDRAVNELLGAHPATRAGQTLPEAVSIVLAEIDAMRRTAGALADEKSSIANDWLAAQLEVERLKGIYDELLAQAQQTTLDCVKLDHTLALLWPYADHMPACPARGAGVCECGYEELLNSVKDT